jgi:hypothetical protein
MRGSQIRRRSIPWDRMESDISLDDISGLGGLDERIAQAAQAALADLDAKITQASQLIFGDASHYADQLFTEAQAALEEALAQANAAVDKARADALTATELARLRAEALFDEAQAGVIANTRAAQDAFALADAAMTDVFTTIMNSGIGLKEALQAAALAQAGVTRTSRDIETETKSLHSVQTVIKAQLLDNWAAFTSFQAAQATENEAIAVQLDALTATTGGNTANITSLQAVVTTNTSAIATLSTRVDVINTANGDIAGLSDTLIAQAAELYSLASRTTTLEASYADQDASIETLQVATTNATQAVAAIQTTLSAHSTAISDLTDAQVDQNATITSLQSTVASAEKASSVKSDTVRAETIALSDASAVNDFVATLQSGGAFKAAMVSAATALAGVSETRSALTSVGKALASFSSVVYAQVGSNYSAWQQQVAAQATLNDATAAVLETLTSSVAGNSANIETLQTTYASLSGSVSTLSTSITSVTTNVATHTSAIAALQTFQVAQTSANAAEAARLDTLTSSVNNNIADIETIQTTQATQAGSISALQTTASSHTTSISTLNGVQTAQGAQITSLQSSMTNSDRATSVKADSLTASTVADADAAAVAAFAEAARGEAAYKAARISAATALSGVYETKLAVTSLGEALSSLSTTIYAQVGANYSEWRQQVAVQATLNAATAATLDTLTSTVNGHTAAISAESVTRADADIALASRIDTVTASANRSKTFLQSSTPSGALTGDIWIDTGNNNSIKRYDGSAWVAVDNTQIAAALAAVSAESTARVNGDNALSNTLTSVSAISNNASANGCYRLVAKVSPTDGATAEFDVQVSTTNGGTYTSAGMSIQIFSNGVRRVKVKADQFIVSDNAGTSLAPFTIASNQVIANALKVPTTNVTGDLPVTQVSGLGDLATLDSVTASSVTGLGAFATLSGKLNSANLATYMDTAAIDSAYINNVNVSKLVAGTMTAGAINIGSTYFQLDASSQKLTVKDTNGIVRVELGALTGGGYGITVKDSSGATILSSGSQISYTQLTNKPTIPAAQVQITEANASTWLAAQAITGTYIKDAAITDAKIYSLSASKLTAGTITAATINITNSDGSQGFYVAPGMTAGVMYNPNFYTASFFNINKLTNDPLSYAVYASGSTQAPVIFAMNNSKLGNAFRGWASSNNGNIGGVVGAIVGYDFYADGSGTNYGPFTGAHDALIALDDLDGLEAGDILVDVACLKHGNISNTLFRVQRSSTANQRGVVGVLAVNSGLAGDFDPPAVFERIEIESPVTREKDENCIDLPVPKTPSPTLTAAAQAEWDELKYIYNRVLMNALGEGQINVCGEGGDLARGDLIVASSTPGKGMRQEDDLVRSYTVAKARESVTFTSPDEVKQIACIYLCG